MHVKEKYALSKDAKHLLAKANELKEGIFVSNGNKLVYSKEPSRAVTLFSGPTVTNGGLDFAFSFISAFRTHVKGVNALTLPNSAGDIAIVLISDNDTTPKGAEILKELLKKVGAEFNEKYIDFIVIASRRR